MPRKTLLLPAIIFGAIGCTQKPVGSCEVLPTHTTVALNSELTTEQKEFYSKNYLPCKQRNKKKDPQALFNVGVAVLYGLGTDKDASKAFLWFKAAADKDHKGAQRILAQMFAQGVGVFRDPLIAQKYETVSRIGSRVD